MKPENDQSHSGRDHGDEEDGGVKRRASEQRVLTGSHRAPFGPVVAGLFVLGVLTACRSSAQDSAIYSRNCKLLFTASLSAARVLSWEVRVLNEEAGFIQAKVPFNLSTRGDLVTIQVEPVGQSRCVVRVHSTSGQPIDWGKNTRNLEAFFSHLDAQVGPRY